MLTAKDILVRYEEHTVVNRVSFCLEAGQWLMLAGPNGAGKTTLINAISQGTAYEGNILWNGQDLKTMKTSDLARKIGILSQKNAVGYAYTVEEVVGLGRYAHKNGFLSSRDSGGKQQIDRALDMTGLSSLRYASMLTLSGGETQRVFLAQVFAQDPQILILDEPANHLDLKYQQHIFDLIGTWLKQPDRAVLSVVHDLSLARKFGTHALLMDHGFCVAQGKTNEVLTRDNLNRVYDMDVYAWMHEMLSQWQENE